MVGSRELANVGVVEFILGDDPVGGCKLVDVVVRGVVVVEVEVLGMTMVGVCTSLLMDAGLGYGI